jgi:predicted Zn-ribbon and HTH transcriptional regulator
MAVSQIARLEDEPPSRVADDFQHLFRSLMHTEYKPVVESVRCRACGFEFSTKKLTKPSKCPECHSTWVLEPKIGIESRTCAGESVGRSQSHLRHFMRRQVLPFRGPNPQSRSVQVITGS